MFSFVVLLSGDRESQFRNCEEIWRDCALFNDCEKIVCFDGPQSFTIDGFEVFEIQRSHKYYCWADALNKGVDLASNEIVFYFDSDRIPESNFFVDALEILESRDAFVYARKLYNVLEDCDVKKLRSIVNDISGYSDILSPDYRVDDPTILESKNPFSGGVGFQKSLFKKFGGFDPRYMGWGYPDYDMFMNVFSHDPNLFVPMDKTELHQKHDKLGEQKEFWLHNLFNLRQYMEKYGLSRYGLEEQRVKLQVPIDVLYESRDLDDFLSKVYHSA